jgi:hypothetical protein
MEERSGPRISGIRVIEKNDVDEALRRESGELIVVGDQAMPNGTPMP